MLLAAATLAACTSEPADAPRTVEEHVGSAGIETAPGEPADLSLDVDAILGEDYRRPGPSEVAAKTTPEASDETDAAADRAELMARTAGWDYIANRMMFGNWTGKLELGEDGEAVAVNAGDVIQSVTIASIDKENIQVAWGGATRAIPWNTDRVIREREQAAQKDIVRAGLQRAREQLGQLPVPEEREGMSFRQRKQIETMKRINDVMTALESSLDDYQVEPQHIDTIMMAAELQYSNLQSSFGNETSYR